MPQPTRLVWRSELGWSPHSPAGYANPKRGLVIHYDGSNKRLADKNHSACVDYWNWCRDFHTNGNGWDDVGYSFMACPHGYVMEGRGLYRQQAAQRGANSTYYSVTLACGPTDEITAEQIDAVRELRAWLMEPDTSIAGRVRGHRDFNSTSCPGDKAYSLVRNGTFRKRPGASIPDMPSGGGGGGGGGRYESYRKGVKAGSRTISLYSAGDDVKVAQAAFDVEDDGWYGPNTVDACEDYQADHGLLVDGITGPKTWGKILGSDDSGDASGPEFPLPSGHWYGRPNSDRRNHSGYYWASDRPGIRRIQRKVNVADDGRYGPKTAAAVRDYQGSHGLAVDGLTGINTWNSMFR